MSTTATATEFPNSLVSPPAIFVGGLKMLPNEIICQHPSGAKKVFGPNQLAEADEWWSAMDQKEQIRSSLRA